MYIDLNVPIPPITTTGPAQSKKGKGKQPQQPQPQQPAVVFTPAQLTVIESRLDILEHLGYTVLGLNQTVQKKIDSKTHVNTVDPLLTQLRKRDRITFVKRLTIVLDEESEKGFGLTTGNVSIFALYDVIALLPTTATTFSQACLSHSAPSNLTAHIISLPLTLPRLPFNLKHTMVRTAIKNGAVFEISYAGALGGDSDPSVGAIGGSEGGSGAKRNWWAAAREIVRVTKGKGIIVTGGVTNVADLRAPRDVGNLITMLDLAQNLANDASTKTPQSLILRAQTRRTYRAVLSEPRLVIPEPRLRVPEQPVASVPGAATEVPAPLPAPSAQDTTVSQPAAAGEEAVDSTAQDTVLAVSPHKPDMSAKGKGKKRTREEMQPVTERSAAESKKKKKKS